MNITAVEINLSDEQAAWQFISLLGKPKRSRAGDLASFCACDIGCRWCKGALVARFYFHKIDYAFPLRDDIDFSTGAAEVTAKQPVAMLLQIICCQLFAKITSGKRIAQDSFPLANKLKI